VNFVSNGHIGASSRIPGGVSRPVLMADTGNEGARDRLALVRGAALAFVFWTA
jgi:hypothetical protein